ncbi:MAG: GTA-gp10 family protein [Sphingopyxis sp.]|nr:GTA-gp10 family protein [Sphingopyxis sp.]
MSGAANPFRGEAELRVAGEVYRLRPTFTALVAAEDELGPLFALAERAAAGGLGLAETAALLWHCIDARPEALTRAAVGEAVAGAGLVAVTPVLRSVLMQILQGR